MSNSSEPEARKGRRPRARERREFSAGAVRALRSLDPRGARFLLTIGEVDGVVSAELIGDMQLRVGRELSEQESKELTKRAHQLQVFDLAVSLLSMRARSSRDLKLGLTRRGATREEAEAAIGRLVELGLLDDVDYARAVARFKAVSGGVSRKRIETVLLRRGINAPVARAAVSEVVDELGLDERAAALEVARKRARQLSGLDAATAKRRLYAFLARRGYAANLVSRVVAEVLGGAPDLDAEAEA